VEYQIMAQQRALESLEPDPPGGALDSLVGHVCEATMAEVREMSDGKLQPRRVVDRDAVGIVVPAADHDDWDVLGHELCHQLPVAAELQHRDSGHPLLEQRPDFRRLVVGIAAGRAHEAREPAP
jgi:hypothetical protein